MDYEPIITEGVGTIGNLLGGALTQSYNRENMELQSEYAKDLMSYQWHNFNSYEAQVRSMIAAGLNPSVLYGHGSSQAASPSVNMPSSAPVQIPNVFDMSSLSDMISSVAQAKKAGMDIDLIEQEIKNLEVQRQTQKFELELKQQFGKDFKSVELANLYRKLLLASDSHDLNVQEKALNDWKLSNSKIENAMLRQKLENLPIAIKLENKLQEEKAKTERAHQNALSASAAQSRANAKLIASQQWQQDYFNQMHDAPEIRNSVFMELKSFGVAAERENILKGEQIEQLKYFVSQSQYADDMKEYTYWIDKATSILGAAATLGGVAGLLKHYSALDKALGQPKVSTTENFSWTGEFQGRSVTTSK